MDDLRDDAGRENVFYQCTDLLIVNSRGMSNLQAKKRIEPDRLGAMKMEARGDSITIHGCYDYVIGRKAVIGHQQLDAYEIGNGRFESVKMTSLLDHLSHNPSACVFARTATSSRSPNYSRGTLDEQGNVEPIELWEPAEKYENPFHWYREDERDNANLADADSNARRFVHA